MPLRKMLFERPPITEADISAAERELGVALPLEYRAFLLCHNGGRPKPESFLFADSGDQGSMVNTLFAVGEPDPMFNLVSRGKGWRARVPNDLLVIGDDAGGSMICIGVRGKREGRVYFWSLEDESDPRDPTNYDNVWLIADSFDAFIEGLHE